MPGCCRRPPERVNRCSQSALKAAGLPELDYCVGSETSLRKVTHANERLRFQGSVPATPTLELARGEQESFQLVLMPFDRPLRGVRVEPSELTGPGGEQIAASEFSLYLPGLVRTQLSPHSNGTELGWVPDPLVPLEAGQSFAVEPESESAVWITLHCPPGTPAGEYSGTITIRPENSHVATVPLRVTVHDYELPSPGMFRTQGHFSIESVEDFYHRRMDNEWLEEWYEFFLRYRFDPVGQYSSYLTPRPELIGFCLERGLRTINLGGFAGASGVDHSALDSVYNYIKDQGWLDYSYVYIGDETDNFELMRRMADTVHSRYPGVRVMIGGSIPRPELVGYIDVWDPIMRPGGVYGFDPEVCRRALARGEEVLWYVCIAPHPPYPNVQMEDPLVDSRSLFWMTYRYDIMGYEYWGYNFWGSNVTPEGEPRWPAVEWNSYAYDHTNGDGQICYPGPGGRPLPSLRLEVNRDGIEDWEALWLLEDLARTARELKLDRERRVAGLVSRAQALADVPPQLVSDLTHYTKDPREILSAREQVSRLIVELRREIGAARAEDYRRRHIEQRRKLEGESLRRNIEAARQRADR